MRLNLLFSFLLLIIPFLIIGQPINDDCSTAIDLGIVPNCEQGVFTTKNATPSNIGENNLPDCFYENKINQDVWFMFQIPIDGNNNDFKISINATTNNFIENPQIAIYRGQCAEGQLSELGVCKAAMSGQNTIEVEAIGLKKETQYFLRIDNYSPTDTLNGGDFTICIEALEPVFNIGETLQTGLCSGTLYDSGGKNGLYGVNENLSFSICPTVFNRCIKLTVEKYDTELEYDNIRIFEGISTELTLRSTVNGKGSLFLDYIASDCITINFTSDASIVGDGFEVTWECTPEICPVFEPLTCDNPHIISNLPFTAADLSTCFAGDNIEDGACGGADFLNGADYVFAYDSPGGECININLTGTAAYSSLAIFRGCPETSEAVCINQIGANEETPDHFLSKVALQEKGRYYFVIANGANCTPFNIDIEVEEDCPKIFPSATNCENALLLNGCNTALPTALTVERGKGDLDFFQKDINNGCWENITATNFTWFTFEAQADGVFAFLLGNNDTTNTVDIDFNIWGPFQNQEDVCWGTENTQPIRSSWADDLIYSTTGLTKINPVLGTPITATCQGIVSDGFVKPLDVKKGEIYAVLINDYDGVIFDGAISIDFSESDLAVLEGLPEKILQSKDTIICLGDTIRLQAGNASLYEWMPSASLSCRTCPNPLASPTETTTYILETSTVCQIIRDTVRIGIDSLLPSEKIPSLPNAFTPGTDGVNDYFNLLRSQTATIINFKIYNRWGKLVYDNDNINKGWDGTLRNSGEVLPSGVYLYKVQYQMSESLQTLSGNVTLIR